jgi:hypothetical protein
VDLGARPWKSLIDDEQPQGRLLRGLCAAVHQVQREGAAAPATGVAIAVAQRKHVDCLDAGRPRERIEMAHCEVAMEVTREVAVRAGFVTAIPSIRTSSSSLISSSRARIPRGGRVAGVMSSMGVPAWTQRAPWSAAAARPATMPRRPDHSQAPTVCCRSDGATSLGT